MARHFRFTATTLAALLLALGACQKSGGGAPAASAPGSGAVTNTINPSPAEVAASQAATATSVGPKAAPVVGRADFAKTAAIGDLYEIQAAKLAERKSTNPEIKRLAARMIRDHTTADEKLGKLLGTNGVGVGVTPATGLDAPHRAMIDKLAAASPADFDRIYIDQQVTAHQQAADLFNGYAQNGDAPPLKAFATDGLPMINDHLALARQFQTSMAKGAGTPAPSPR